MIRQSGVAPEAAERTTSPCGTTPPEPRPAAASDAVAVVVYPPGMRAVSAVLVALAAAAVPVIAALFVADAAAGALALPPLRAARLLFAFALAPAAFARALAWAFTGRLVAGADAADIETRRARHHVPRSAWAEIRLWRLPLPSAGLMLRTHAGRTWTMAAARLDELLVALGEPTPAAAPSALAAYTVARGSAAHRRLRALAVKFVLFPCAPAVVIFRTHQLITYGGALGEYYLLGLRPYLATFGRIFLETATQLVLYAGVWRALAEAVTLVATLLAPRQARQARRAAEVGLGLVYYVGIPALLALRFLV
jgi:hypothetical protein